jgi:DNA polymerase-3 subunit alpha
MSKYWSAHTHSKFSVRDALPTVEEIVNKASELKYPALGLTDHGNMAGAVQLYTNCKKYDIKPLPGVEAYVTYNKHAKRPETVHMGLLATTQKGYRNLVGLVTKSHQQHKYRPLLDLSDLASAAESGMLDGIAGTSGCWFGNVAKLARNGNPEVDLRLDNMVTSLDGWFGSGFYVEIQNHVIVEDDHDDDQYGQMLFDIANRNGLPVIITQDSHYVEESDRKIHDTLKYYTSFSSNPTEACFPGDGYHMVDSEWMEDHHSSAIYAAGIEGLTDLASKANVVIPELDKFSLQVPDTTIKGTPNDDLRTVVTESMNEQFYTDRINHSHHDTYFGRIEYELDVVVSQNFSGYLLFVARICHYMRQQNIGYNVRGSASGSLLCWLLGITSLDPVVWGLSSDRFLTKDQVKAPDIDIDIEHDRRLDVVEWLKNNFHVTNISTWAMQTIQEEKDWDGDRKITGSLLTRFITVTTRLGIAHKYKKTRSYYKNGEEFFKSYWDLPKKEMNELIALSNKQTYGSYGVHAAGLLVTPDIASAEVVPLMHVSSSDTMVTAFDKDDVEKLGLLKVDLLGLKKLTALRKLLEYTGRPTHSIPLDDEKTFIEISKGRTDGLFQLEGPSSNKGVKALRPTKIDDIIAAMALFRPATDEKAVESYIKRRHGKEKIPVQHELIQTETAPTYGILLYQEQVISILKSIGFDASELEKARKLIKASKNSSKEVSRVKDHIAKLGKSKGMDAKDIAWLKDSLDAYANYGFNKAHATAYGLVAYYTGYYSVHYPLEFWASMLDVYANSDKEDDYLIAAKKAGIKILDPHVNVSEMSYTLDTVNKAIRRGLQTVDKVGAKAAEEIAKRAPYESLDDFARKVSGARITGAKELGAGIAPELCKGMVPNLFKANAFEGLERENR